MVATHEIKISRQNKAETVVIATIILIAATVVIALVTGAYVYGLFGSNVKQIKLVSANLDYGTASNATSRGSANLQLSLQNPGGATTITSFTMHDSDLSSVPKMYQCSSATSCNLVSSVAVAAASVSNYYSSTSAFYVGLAIQNKGTYSYAIQFANGQSITGYVVAE